MATKTFITKDNLSKFASLVKSADSKLAIRINEVSVATTKAQVTADNAVTAAAGALTEAQKKIAQGSLATINGQSLEKGGNLSLADIGIDGDIAEIVTALPELTAAKSNKLYLLKSEETVDGNSYGEYIKITESGTAKWEKIGEWKAYITVDSQLSETSTNPVQNKVVNESIMMLYNAIAPHLEDINNPHKVTKAQVGLGNVDNTSDANKPISTATQTALNNKVDKVSGKGLSTNDYTTDEKNKLAGIAANANNYSLPLSASGTRGGIQIGYAANGKNYPVQLSNEKAFVNVPWTDTTYKLAVVNPITLGEDFKLVLSKDGTAQDSLTLPTATANTKNGGMTIAGMAGLLSANDKTKIDALETTYVAEADLVTLTDDDIATLWDEAAV